uniref:Uncharacterized protein n=1 Tax=Mycena chlorophos TaxID=658473 RepID=A0ABQ0L570_MYCCL|nr:predicted protein [Mycena chlorophos]
MLKYPYPPEIGYFSVGLVEKEANLLHLRLRLEAVIKPVDTCSSAFVGPAGPSPKRLSAAGLGIGQLEPDSAAYGYGLIRDGVDSRRSRPVKRHSDSRTVTAWHPYTP